MPDALEFQTAPPPAAIARRVSVPPTKNKRRKNVRRDSVVDFDGFDEGDAEAPEIAAPMLKTLP